jgi:hypothetical protein
MLVQECYYFIAHQEDIIKDHSGEWVVIRGNNVFGYYKGLIEALQEMAKLNIALGTFAVYKCKIGAAEMSVY